ncbi:MAG: AMIN domain-containing protein [Halioglobus sp.]
MLLSPETTAAPTEVGGIRLGVSPDKTRIVFDLSAPTNYRLQELEDPPRLVVELDTARMAPEVERPVLSGTEITKLDVESGPDGSLRYTLYLRQPVRPDLFILKPYLERGDRLVLDLFPLPESATAQAGAAIPAAAVPMRTERTPPMRSRQLGERKRPLPADREGGDYAGEWTGYISVDSRLFFSSPAYPKQDDQNISAALWPALCRLAGGSQRFAFVPYYRYDANDAKRTHADIRELYWQIDYRQISFKAGIDVVFWGVAESQHLVDIINQTDLVENLDGEDKSASPCSTSITSATGEPGQVLPASYFRTVPSRASRGVCATTHRST